MAIRARKSTTVDQRKTDRGQARRDQIERKRREADARHAKQREEYDREDAAAAANQGAFAEAAAELGIVVSRLSPPPLEIPEPDYTEEEKAIDAANPLEQPSLVALAVNINGRFHAASQNEKHAAGHRLAAAKLLVEAEQAVRSAGQRWKTWCTANVKQQPRTVAQLLAIGKSENPEVALEELRARNAFYNKELRERKKLLLTGPATTQAPAPSATTAETVLTEPAADRGIGGTGAPAASTRYITVESLLADYAQLPPDEQREFLARVPQPEERAA